MNPYAQTLAGDTIDLLAPNYGHVSLATLTEALSYISRFTGHVGWYSVAQHSVHVAAHLADQGHGRGVQAGGLLHDLHEAVIGDLSTPVKDAMAVLGFDFRGAFEAAHVRAVERRFAVHTRHPAIKRMDAVMCNTEADQLMGGRKGPGWPSAQPLRGWTIPEWSHERARREFMDWADRLCLA